MRLLLTLLAVLGLLASPVTAAAAQASCGHCNPMAATGMATPAAAAHAHMAGFMAMSDPCCDPSGKSHNTSHGSCTGACAAACVGAVALPASLGMGAPAPARAPLDLPALTYAQGHEPAGLERPPKSIA